jgi:hypothetical protein
MDCTSEVIRRLREEEFWCESMQQMLEELKSVKYLTVMVDTSNHCNLKLVRVAVRHFTREKRVQTKVIEFCNLRGQTADVPTTRNECTASGKIIAFCGHSCNRLWRGGGLQGEEQTMFLPSWTPAI